MSECEIAQYYICKEHIARKPHVCCECTAPIDVGEQYLQVNACWEGRPDVYRQHKLCQEACELIRDKGMNGDGCLYFGELKEFWPDSYGIGWRTDVEEEDRRKLWQLMLRITRRERKAAGK